ncbi:lycopene beta-cyclase CrtY [uncultured Erythrobacter sp.]|uniref:lycopene beta-cyclase CrtY n=1 Tax=uncultured Erythrobacter sp. TaxID=263913 RepID=UPI00261C9BA0|nr:lycopene beta-cyclase CrtY [uncultured Erythrobacter sp.]
MNDTQVSPRIGQQLDCVIVGGGLAGGLIALALQRARPDFRIALVEAGKVLGGNHRWSWFDSDLSGEGRALLSGFRQTEWDDGYEVAFPQYCRALKTPYRSMASADFHSGLVRELPEDALMLGRKAVSLDARGVDIEDSQGQVTRLEARSVIDCRPFEPSLHLTGGWQVFLGRHMRMEQPHHISRPVIMDAHVDQLAPHGNGGAYRFVYVLPLGAHDLFVEDTYYADEPALDRSALSARIDAYATAKGWSDYAILGHETGMLPVLTGGDFAAHQRSVRIEGVTLAGARGGFTHPLTSYTLPMAVENAIAIARDADLTGLQLSLMFEARARRHWSRTSFYRLLARMLFHAAKPERRVQIFQRFYRLRPGLIERFYAARSTLMDKTRILAGKPPVSIMRAIAAIFSRGTALTRNPTPKDNE